MTRILLIDECQLVRDQVREAVDADVHLTFASTLAEARSQLQIDPVDLILMETHFLDGDGFVFCSEIKCQESRGSVPVIFYTDRGSISEKVKGFRTGATDYLVKPIDSQELSARIAIRLRESETIQGQEPVLEIENLILSIPFQKAVLRDEVGEMDLRLTPTEFRLLYFFIKNEGVVLSRSQLLSTIWSSDVHVLTRTIDKHISTLKKKLASRAQSIQSVHSKGYRFSLNQVSGPENRPSGAPFAQAPQSS